MGDKIVWARQETTTKTWVHPDQEFTHRLITNKKQGSSMSFHITTYMPNFDVMVEGDGKHEVILYCLHGHSRQIVEATGEEHDFRPGDAMYLPTRYRYRHIVGDAGLVIAVCANPSKEDGDM
ncbi:L-ectoine synthase [Faunimonas pinastri]|uniref:L-ectoine synthase n=1 Tax=Faunimonas pinastri TaxID=1855383 RepID=A0A1H9E6I1_9HYPH|nr:ectoine synthase [Faunimonas pinastri]SEQ21222.1 L-ectoine synthase [Faunimonas pinastri]